MKAHQRVIREKEAARDVRAAVPLSGCTVEKVDRDFAKQIILRYEWLGTMPRHSTAFYGLRSPDGEPLGVSCFGYGPGSRARDVCGPDFRDRTIVLERGACVHFAHPHAGSFLTSRAVSLCSRDLGYNVFIAYSDAEAGEIGTIYQACNWLYLGAGNGRGGAGRWEGRPLGGKWMSSRDLRGLARSLGYTDTSLWWAEYRARADWEFRHVASRARYVTFAGDARLRKAARAALRYPALLYPKRST